MTIHHTAFREIPDSPWIEMNTDTEAARHALGAFIRACHQQNPNLAADIEKRYLGGGAKVVTEMPKAPVTADVFKTSAYHTRSVTADALIRVGLAEVIVRKLFDLRHDDKLDPTRSIPWARLALRDGMLALAVLSSDELLAISNELRSNGAPGIPLKTPSDIVSYLFVAAEMFCPTDEWADRALQSTVAASILLKVAQAAWMPVALVKG